MIENQIKETCRKLKPLLGEKADALWLGYVTAETPQARMEAEVLIQMCAMRHLTRKVDDHRIFLPPPSRNSTSGEFFLGTVSYGDQRQQPLYLTRENFMKHIGIFSITGGGKTNVCFNLLLGLLKANLPFLVVDWKRSYRTLRSLPNNAVKRLRVFTVGRKTSVVFNWNPLRGPPNVHPRTWISVLVEALEKSHISGQGVADILMDVLDKKFEEFGVYDGDHDQYPNFFDIREELERLHLKGRRMLWPTPFLSDQRHDRLFITTAFPPKEILPTAPIGFSYERLINNDANGI